MFIIVSYKNTCSIYSVFFFFSSRRRHTRSLCDWSSDVCSSDLLFGEALSIDRLAQQCAEIFAGSRAPAGIRSEERRVGKECRYRGESYYEDKRSIVK